MERLFKKQPIKKQLGIVLFVMFFAGINASTYSNKTFLAPRTTLANMPMEYSLWHKVFNKTPADQSGFKFQFTGFYQESTNKTNVGKYFGVSQKNFFKIADNPSANLCDVAYDFIFHDNGHVAGTTAANIKFEPNQEVWGLRIDYYQDLKEILSGFYFKANTAIIDMKNNMRMKISDTANLFATNNNLQKYFVGKYEVIDAATNNLQEPLKYAKIGGKQTVSGFADVDLYLGYKLLDNSKQTVSIDLNFLVPTGNKVKGDYLFAPIRGNGRHYALGGNVDAQVILKEWKKSSLKFIYALNYKYLFENGERRTLGINRTVYNATAGIVISPNLSHYYLLGKESANTNQQLIPAANILTTMLDVTPASQVENLIAFAFSFKKFTLDLGYDLFLKEKEHIKIKDNPFNTYNYGIAETNYSTANAFNTAACDDSRFLTFQDLDLESVKTPAQVTNKIFGSLGFTFDKKGYTALIGLGASYEFATNNSELENWALWLKAGVSF